MTIFVGDMLCEMCGKRKARDSHHTIPIIFGGDDSDIIQVCPVCHRKGDGTFFGFILHPFGLPKNYIDPEKHRNRNKIYRKRHIFRRGIYHLTLQPNTALVTNLDFNNNSGSVYVRTDWYVNHRGGMK